MERMIPSFFYKNGVEFIFNNSDIQECDAWFIFDSDGLRYDSSAICSPDKVFFVMGECDQIQIYNKKFVRQFPNLITAQNFDYGVEHLYKDYYPFWFVGLKFGENGILDTYLFDYDSLSSMSPIKKTKMISVISSNKKMCKGHKDRLLFIEKLKKYFKDKIDIFGRGINGFEDKWDVLAPYKYHIAIENQQQDYYITEKLHDPFLAFCYPLYYGAKNVDAFFDKSSYLSLDINNFQKSFEQIEELIESDPYESVLENVIKSRSVVLNRQNMFYKMVKLAIQKSSSSPKNFCFCEEFYFSLRYRLKKILNM